MFICYSDILQIKKPDNQVKISRRFLLYSFPLLLLGLIIFLYPYFFYANLIDPITRILWLIVRLVRAFDQEVIWNLIIFIVVMVEIRILSNHQENESQSAYSKSDQAQDRISFWEHEFSSADADASDRLSLQHDLEELSDSINEIVNGGDISEISLPKLKTKIWHRLLEKGLAVFSCQSKRKTKFQDTELEGKLNQILETMESKMEKQNGQSPSKSKNR